MRPCCRGTRSICSAFWRKQTRRPEQEQRIALQSADIRKSSFQRHHIENYIWDVLRPLAGLASRLGEGGFARQEATAIPINLSTHGALVGGRSAAGPSREGVPELGHGQAPASAGSSRHTGQALHLECPHDCTKLFPSTIHKPRLAVARLCLRHDNDATEHRHSVGVWDRVLQSGALMRCVQRCATGTRLELTPESRSRDVEIICFPVKLFCSSPGYGTSTADFGFVGLPGPNGCGHSDGQARLPAGLLQRAVQRLGTREARSSLELTLFG